MDDGTWVEPSTNQPVSATAAEEILDDSLLCEPLGTLVEEPSFAVLGDSLMDFTTDGNCRHVADHMSFLTNKTIPSFAVGGASFTGTRPKTIGLQYDRAREHAALQGTKLKTVIFDGGGNDILWGNELACLFPNSPRCDDMMDWVEREWVNMVETMQERDGVATVVYVGIYKMQGIWGLYGRAFEKFKHRMVDLCAAYGVVHVDLEPVFEGRSDEWMAPDKLHPNNRGTYAIAAAILAALEGN